MGTFPTPTVSFRRNPAGTTKIVIAATAMALNVAVESRPLVGGMHCRSQSGEGSSEFRAFDGRLGTAVVLHVGEKKRVVLVATGLLDRVAGGC